MCAPNETQIKLRKMKEKITDYFNGIELLIDYQKNSERKYSIFSSLVRSLSDFLCWPLIIFHRLIYAFW